MTEENPSTIEDLKEQLKKLESELLDNFDTPEEWGTAELARHHARRLSVARADLFRTAYFGHNGEPWSAIARILDAEIFLRELGGEK